MATFPALTPSSRTFTPGERPHSQIRTLSGSQVRVRQSNVLVNQRLRLTFIGLTEAEMLSIRSHYVGQQGRFLSFDIPNELLSGVTTPASFTPTGYSWIYASTPIIEDIGCGRYSASLELVTVPPEGANVNGADFSVAVSMIAGVGSASVSTVGFALTVSAAFEAGAPGGDVTFEPSGFNLQIATTFTPGEATATNATDPDFSSVSLLLHLDGSNGGTTFTDNSSNANTMTRGGNAQLNTSAYKFGTASVVWDGSGDYLRTPDSTLFEFGTGDFTIEFWSYFASGFNTGAASILMSIGAFRNITYTGTTLRFRTDGGTNLITGGALSTQTWYHIALIKSGNDHKLFIDGTQTGSTYTSSTSYTAQRITFGANNSGQNNYLGNMDDIRVTKGVARYTSNFTAPTQPFPDS